MSWRHQGRPSRIHRNKILHLLPNPVILLRLCGKYAFYIPPMTFVFCLAASFADGFKQIVPAVIRIQRHYLIHGLLCEWMPTVPDLQKDFLLIATKLCASSCVMPKAGLRPGVKSIEARISLFLPRKGASPNLPTMLQICF